MHGVKPVERGSRKPVALAAFTPHLPAAEIYGWSSRTLHLE